jgi:transposase
MLRVEHDRWDQNVHDLRHLSVTAPHARSRERFMALYDIARGSNATLVAQATGRNHQTVQEWVKRYNADGPDVIGYRRTGGRSPLLTIANAVSFDKV